ncbi:hypothetical protein BDV32DRAFT_119041 [Aspergillus pseudonomiae]|nr:hypothetical protein BDV32DRAFT_119041 [Aspergillus pseudonomiae]
MAALWGAHRAVLGGAPAVLGNDGARSWRPTPRPCLDGPLLGYSCGRYSALLDYPRSQSPELTRHNTAGRMPVPQSRSTSAPATAAASATGCSASNGRGGSQRSIGEDLV